MRFNHRMAAACLCLLGIVSAGACSKDPKARTARFVASGNAYFDAGKYQEAIIEYRNAVALTAASGEARLKLARSYERVNDQANAFAEFIRAADLLPEDDDTQLTAGAYLLRARRFDDARLRAEAVLARQPKRLEAQVLLGNTLGGLKNFGDAIAEMEEAIKLDPQRASTYANLGVLELGRGNRAAAEAAFKKAVELAPTWVPGHLALANHYWATNSQDVAETTLREAFELEPNNPLTNRALALLYVARGRAGDAEPYVRALTASGAAPFALADYYLAQNRPRDSIAALRSVTSVPATESRVAGRLARAYVLDGDVSNANQVTDQILQRNDKDINALLIKAQLLERAGNRDEALQRVKDAVQANERSASAQFALGRLYGARGDWDGARQAFNQVLRVNPRAAAAQVELARLELVAGRPGASVQLARDALRSQPSNPEAELALIRGLLASKDIAPAETRINDLLRKYPNVSSVHVQRGLAYAAKNDLLAARRAFEHAAALAPSSVEPLTALVSLDLATKNFSAARERVETERRRHGDTPQLLLIAARTYAADRDFVKAEQCLRAALLRDPTLAQGYAMLAQLYTSQGKLDDARRELEQLADRQTNPVSALTMLGMIAQQQGNKAAARQHFQHVLDIDSRAAIAANNLAWLEAEDNGNLDFALDLAQRAVNVLPHSPEVRDTLGWIYYRKQQSARAIEALSETVAAAPQHPVYHYHLGLAHLQAGDVTRARQALNRALALNGAFDGADDVRRLLTTLPRESREVYPH